MTYLKIKGQEASSWLKMLTRKIKILTKMYDKVYNNLSPPQARKNYFIYT